MNTSLYITTGALHTYQQKLDTMAQNVANVNTVGYKKREATFSENLASEISNQVKKEDEKGRLTPNGIRVGYGVHLGQTSINMEQGSAQETGNPYDLMIEGKGFFSVSHFVGPNKDGAESETRYTRDGSFKLSPTTIGGSYNLVNSQGDYLLDDQGDPIEIEQGYQVKISETGEILLTNSADPTDFFTGTQRIGLVDIANPQILQSVGGNQYAIREDILAQGDTPDRWVKVMDLTDDGSSKLRQGALETSNVDLTKEMSELMISQKGFQLNSRALSYADQMLGIANGIMRG